MGFRGALQTGGFVVVMRYFTKQPGLSYMHRLLNLREPEFPRLYNADNA